MSEETYKAIATASGLIAAGKKAAAEGLTIVAQSRTRWGGRRAPAPCPRFKSVPKPEPKPAPPDYALSNADHANVKAVVTMMKMANLSKSASLRAAAYRDVGTRLHELRQNRGKAEWGDILHRECGLSLRRAYELVAMATGAKPMDPLSYEASAGVKQHREKKAA
jgi:hypothetical protein